MAVRSTLIALGVPAFLLGWLIALVGVSLLQSKCIDADDEFKLAGSEPGSFLAPTPGSGCRKSLRFVWWILALCLVPTTLSVLALFQPRVWTVTNSSLWSLVAVFAILITNFLYNLLDSLDGAGTLEDMYGTRVEVAMVGTCLMTVGALVNVLLASLMVSSDHSDQENAVFQKQAHQLA